MAPVTKLSYLRASKLQGLIRPDNARRPVGRSSKANRRKRGGKRLL